MPQDEYDEQHVERRRGNGTGLMVAIASLALALMVQFAGTVWWGATMSADQRHVTEALARMEVERYTKADAARDILRLDQRDNTLADQQRELSGRIARIEDRIK